MRRTLRLVLAAAAVAALLPLGTAGARARAATITVSVSGAGVVTGSASVAARATTAARSRSAVRPHSGVIPDGSDVHMQATFGYVEVLDVSTEGDGQGTVVSQPRGISCGHVCATAYAARTAVNLTAIPRRGSVFAGWRGWCSGQGGCTVQATGTAWVSAVFVRQTGHSQPFAAASGGASAAIEHGQRILVLDFRTSQPALVRLAVSGPTGYQDSARINVHAGPVRVKLPLGAGAPAGRYAVVAQLTAAGGVRTLRWSIPVA